MGKRIKVTGYLDVEDLNEDMIDLDHKTGLTAEGHDELVGTLLGLGDVEVTLIDG